MEPITRLERYYTRECSPELSLRSKLMRFAKDKLDWLEGADGLLLYQMFREHVNYQYENNPVFFQGTADSPGLYDIMVLKKAMGCVIERFKSLASAD